MKPEFHFKTTRLTGSSARNEIGEVWGPPPSHPPARGPLDKKVKKDNRLPLKDTAKELVRFKHILSYSAQQCPPRSAGRHQFIPPVKQVCWHGSASCTSSDCMTSCWELACTWLAWSTTGVSSGLPEKYHEDRPSSLSVCQIRAKEIMKAIGSLRSTSGKALLGLSCNIKRFKAKNKLKKRSQNPKPNKQSSVE